MWEPWIGKRYDLTRLLLLGESAYSWHFRGQVVHPPSGHHVHLVERAIRDLRDVRHMACLTRALANEPTPTAERRQFVWDRAAYTNYVNETVGIGPRRRPSPEMWKDAREAFPGLLELLKPTRVMVLGRQMWSFMPPGETRAGEDLKGYNLSNGEIAWCHRFRHPSRGLGWRTLAATIQAHCGEALADHGGILSGRNEGIL